MCKIGCPRGETCFGHKHKGPCDDVATRTETPQSALKIDQKVHPQQNRVLLLTTRMKLHHGMRLRGLRSRKPNQTTLFRHVFARLETNILHFRTNVSTEHEYFAT